MIEELEKFTGYRPILKIEFFPTDHNFNTDYSDTRGKEEAGKQEASSVLL
jgi:hypothetical protein